MPLASGTTLGPYEIVAPLGAGGMGEVYKARDTRLDRVVAIKVSKEDFSERFEREARAVAALNHRHICALYDVGPNYLVMEYVEGVPLKGPLPVPQALKCAGEICEALSEAHAKGVTHRDLKPANILVTKSAGVKLLDFGLAKIQPVVSAEDETLTMALTAKGQIVGTVFYMSPEQVQGQEAGPASDIFSFGLVLYEMLTGKRAFDGKSAASVIAAILERPTPSVADVAPASLDRVLRRCLEKDPENRWRSARDLGAALECIAAPESNTATPVPPQADVRPARKLPWAVAAVLAIAALALGFVSYRHVSEEAPRTVKLFLPPPDRATYTDFQIPAVSPDGRRVAFIATRDGKTELWVRDLDALAARLLTGTDGAQLPFWSPDGRFIGFFADGKLKKIDVAGGPALTLYDAGTQPRGGTWTRDDVIVFMPDRVSSRHLFRVSAAGGSAVQLPVSASEASYKFPWFLPDGRHFLYDVTELSDRTKSAIYAGDLDAKTSRPVMIAASNVVYAAGYLLFMRERTLMAQPFDAAKTQTTGDAVPIAEQVDYINIDQRGHFSSSQNGVLAYFSGGSGGLTGIDAQLTWFDRSGKALGTIGTPGGFSGPAISPDGATVAIDRLDPQTGTRDLWLYNPARGADSRFTFGPGTRQYPIWSPDGGQMVFRRTGDGSLVQKATSGVVPEEALDTSKANRRPDDWSRDGRYIIEETGANPKTREDIWVLPLFGDKKPFAYLETEFSERGAKLSPNGQWLAYSSDETKRNEVYVQTFPTRGGKWQVSTNGGDRPVWSRDGRELFFIGADNKMMAAEVKNSGGKFEPGAPKPLFDTRLNANAGYDVAKDGRFLIPVPAEQTASATMVVVLNWPAALKK